MYTTGISDAYYCAECTRLEKDRDGCPKIVNLGASRTDLFYERRRLGESFARSLTVFLFVFADGIALRCRVQERLISYKYCIPRIFLVQYTTNNSIDDNFLSQQ